MGRQMREFPSPHPVGAVRCAVWLPGIAVGTAAAADDELTFMPYAVPRGRSRSQRGSWSRCASGHARGHLDPLVSGRRSVGKPTCHIRVVVVHDKNPCSGTTAGTR
jgi:hypothetical protein